MSRKPLVCLGVAAVVCSMFATAAIEAAPQSVSIRAFDGAAVTRPQAIALGPDGAMWFTNEEGHSIGRITARGVLSSYTDSTISTPSGITLGPDGALWFLNGTGSIGRITVTGVVTTFPSSNIGSPVGIAVGPDGAIWFATGGKAIGRMTTDGVVKLFVDPIRMRGTYGIAAGPDGALWFTNYFGSSIGRISLDGAVSSYIDPRIRYPVGITTGPDGALWFTDDSGSIGRITTAGVVSSFGDSSTVGHPVAITDGPDGALWATDRSGSIVRITPGGVISRFTDPTIQFPVGIAAGRDGALWFANYTGNSIGRLGIVPAVHDAAAPRLTIGRTGTVVSARWVVHSGGIGAVRVRVRIDRSASLTFTVRDPHTGLNLRLQPGSRLGATVLKHPAAALSASLSGPETFVVEAELATVGLTRGREYQIVLHAVGITGRRSEAKISFRG